MGFKPEETHYKLVFEDPALSGLEVTVAEVTVGELAELAELTAGVQPGVTDPETAKKTMRLLAMLGESLVSWNLEDRNGDPVPATAEGVNKQTLKLVLQIVMAWTAAMAAVDIPLPNGSSDGETSLEPSIQMDLQSQSPGS